MDKDRITFSDLCEAIHEERKLAAYLAARGVKPPGVPSHLKQGLRHQLTSRQAFWMALLVKLFANDVALEQCDRVAKATKALFARLKGKTNLPPFNPFDGVLIAKGVRWNLEIGDQRAGRLVAETKTGMNCFPWLTLRTLTPIKKFEPEFMFRLNLDGIAQAVADLEAELRDATE